MPEVEKVYYSAICEKTSTEIRKLKLEDWPVGFLLSAVERRGKKMEPNIVRAQGPVAQ